jgi:hypothetical protein
MKTELDNDHYKIFKSVYQKRGKQPIIIEKEENKGFPVYTTKFPNSHSEHGEQYESSLDILNMSVMADMGIKEPFYRGARIEHLERALETGHDLPEMCKGKNTWATQSIKKAAEYGRGSKQLILIYDNDSFESAGNKDYAYEVIFKKEPKKALKGAIIIHDSHQEDK